MGEAYFYHLTESPLEEALPQLVERARKAGWRVEVRGRDAAVLEMLDAALWAGPPERFVPHGRAGGPHDALQPVLLRLPSDPVAPDMPNAPCLMCVAGAEVSGAEVAARARTCVVFDGHDPEALDRARTQWKALTGAGAGAQYWAQQDGTWVCKQKKDAAT